jgi:cell division GTPase FtsZ
LARLDALLSGVLMSLHDLLFGDAERGVTTSDLKSLFKEGKEGSLFIGGGDPSKPCDAASEFLSCGLLGRDPKTAKGILLNLVKPGELNSSSTKPLIDEIFNRLGKGKTAFIGTMSEPDRIGSVDMIGIITGMDDGSVSLSKLCAKEKAPTSPSKRQPSTGRWDIPMIR